MQTAAIRRALLVPTVLVMGSAIGCSAELNGNLDSVANLNGHWMMYLDSAGTETGPSPLFFTQNGTSVDGAGIGGSVSGPAFTLVGQNPAMSVNLAGTQFGTTTVGTFLASLLGGLLTSQGDFRLVPFTPSGAVDAAGMFGGQSININTNLGIGARDYSDPGLSVLDQVEVISADENVQLEIDFDPTGLTVGTHNVPGDIAVGASYTDDSTTIELAATGGTVTITQYDGAGFAGAYTLMFPGGETLTGSFDVVYDINAYNP